MKSVSSSNPKLQNAKSNTDVDEYWDEEEEEMPDYTGSAFLMDVTTDDEVGSTRLDS